MGRRRGSLVGMCHPPQTPRLQFGVFCALFLGCSNAALGAPQRAGGHFDIKMTPLDAGADGIGRYSFTKKFHGDLDGTSLGEMLGVRTQTPGSAAYVVIEHVTARLGGRSGGFMLQHEGIMDRGRLEMKIVIVPDSGTEGLAGISGTMTIDPAANHAYVLTYDIGGKK